MNDGRQINKDGAAQRAPMRSVLYVLIFAAAVFGARALDIFHAAADADVTYTDAEASALGAAQVILFSLALAFAGAVVICAASFISRRAPYAFALSFSCVIFLDRAFYTVYCVLTREIAFSASAGALPYVEVFAETLLIAASFFVCAAYSARRPEKVEAFPYVKCGAVFCGALTLSELALTAFGAIRFFAEYDDVTTAETLSVVTDLLTVVLKYGVAMFAAVFFFCALQRFAGRRKNRGDGRFSEKIGADSDKTEKV